MEANRPSLSSASFFFSRTHVCGLLIYQGLGSVLYGVLAEVQLFQSFLLCPIDIYVQVMLS